ncbi:hypothetical protein NQ317_007629 [Molorchus minor]|uniref:Uncharacterized protein n=1 Tax=Molorchus minor TaxID=1323400 RepID=A0ABQ9J810_9CUCU|nr:hypothetical protein NQ317_007629 [Molorchus minor]
MLFNEPEIQYKYKNIVDNTQDEPGDSICCKQKKRFWILLRMILQRVLEKLHVRAAVEVSKIAKKIGGDDPLKKSRPERLYKPPLPPVDGHFLGRFFPSMLFCLKRDARMAARRQAFGRTSIRAPRRPTKATDMGFYQDIKDRFGYSTMMRLKTVTNTNCKLATLRNRQTFLIKCRKYNIFPKHITDGVKNVANLTNAAQGRTLHTTLHFNSRLRKKIT